MFPAWIDRTILGPMAAQRGRTLVLTALLSGMLFPATTCPAQNLAPNPGFESGDTSGWSPFGATTISAQGAQVHSGNFAGLVQNRTATWNGIAQAMQTIIQPGQTYNIGVWVRVVS